MNPLVSEMLGVSARNDLEIQSLEELLNDDCKCESEHEESQCSYSVTHLVVTECGTEGRICLNAYKIVAPRLNHSDYYCAYCGQDHDVCVWTIRPI